MGRQFNHAFGAQFGQKDAKRFTISVLTTQNFFVDRPRGPVFLTADLKLQEAAILSGFDAKQI